MAKKSLPLSQVYQLLEPGPVVLVTTCFNGKPNVMAMSWHTMIDFVPPLVGCVMSDQNHSFHLLEQSGECVINIPTADMAETVVKIGNCSGSTVNKFETFLHHPHNSTTCSKNDIKAFREFLTHAGVSVSAYEAGEH